MIDEILYITIVRFLYSVPILTVAIFAAEVLNSIITKEKIEKFLKETRRTILGASLIGLVTPGPLAPYIPLLRVLKKNGLPLASVVAFITSQTLVGPLRAFLEVDFFGALFFICRVVISFLISIGIGVCYQIFGKRLRLDIYDQEEKTEKITG